MEHPKKFQRQRSVKELVIPNDKLSKKVMHLTDDKFRGCFGGSYGEVDEEFKFKGEQVTSQFWFELKDDVTDLRALDEFDFDVLVACISAQDVGCEGVTLTEINRIMSGGKVHNTNLYPPRREKILQSVKRMMRTTLQVDFTKLAKTGKYPDLPESGRLTSTILPCSLLEGATINGRHIEDAVHFQGVSPLLIIAKTKSQLLRCPVGLLDVPKQNNTETVTKLKNYVTRRVLEIQAHKNLKPTICFKSIYENCGLKDATKWQLQDARKTILEVLKHLKEQGAMRDYAIEKEGNSYRAVNIVR